MKGVALVWCAGVSLAGALACSVDDQVQPAAAGGSGGSGGSSSQCNTLVNDGQHVVPSHQPTAPPAALGGAISDGRYVLTAYTLFDGPNGQPINLGDFWASDILQVAGSTMQSIEGYQMDGLEHLPGTTRSYTFAVSGSKLTLSETCPTPTPSIPEDFTATAADYRQYVPAADSTAELTFTKQ